MISLRPANSARSIYSARPAVVTGSQVVPPAEPILADLPPACIVPVEYAVAVDRYLSAAHLSTASRRVYKISLTTWCWSLVGQRPPPGRSRRGAAPPVVPLALLDDADACSRLAAA